jgi:hypothetical protein
MKLSLLYSLLLLLLVGLNSCKKEEDPGTLPVTFKSETSVIESANAPKYGIYPNPFTDYLFISASYKKEARIKIINKDGNYKDFTFRNSSQVVFDFSNCDDNVFRCEILIDGTVYCETLYRANLDLY